MPGSTTKYISFQDFQTKGQSASTVVKLMLACNDLSVANQSLGDWKLAKAEGDRSIRPGGGMYFVRMQVAHLYEAFHVLEEMKKDDVLMLVLAGCDQQTQQSFSILEDYMCNGPKRAEFIRLVERLRHNFTFHYQADKCIVRAIEERANFSSSRMSSITRGSDVRRWHFQIADDILDGAVVRQLWQIPRETNAREGADEAVSDIHTIFVSFMDFAGEFIWRYCSK